MNQKRYAIGLDIGGSGIRGALISNEKNIIPDSFIESSIDCNESREKVAQNIFNVINAIYQNFPSLNILGVGIGTCGRIDPETGVFHDHLKYKAFNGTKIREEFFKLIPHPDMILKIEGDTNTFLLGEIWGSSLANQRILGVTIGSGIGLAFYDDNKILKEGKNIPRNGAIWSTPLWDVKWITPKLMEQPVRRGGIIYTYKLLRLLDGRLTKHIDVKDIAQKALRGEKGALRTFKICDWAFGKLLKSWAKKFEPKIVILGGKISKSFILFNKHALKLSKKYNFVIHVSKNIDTSPLIGAASLILDP